MAAEIVIKGFDLIWQLFTDGVVGIFATVATGAWLTRGLLDDLRQADKIAADRLAAIEKQLQGLQQLIKDNNLRREQILTEKIDGLRTEVRELLVQRQGYDRRVDDRGRAEGNRRVV